MEKGTLDRVVVQPKRKRGIVDITFRYSATENCRGIVVVIDTLVRSSANSKKRGIEHNVKRFLKKRLPIIVQVFGKRAGIMFVIILRLKES